MLELLHPSIHIIILTQMLYHHVFVHLFLCALSMPHSKNKPAVKAIDRKFADEKKARDTQ